MPTYEYVCVKCGEQFVRIMSLKDYEAGQFVCPNGMAFQIVKPRLYNLSLSRAI